MPAEWNLHVLRVVIEDGDSERRVDEVFTSFEVVFWADEQLHVTSEKTKSAMALEKFFYRVNAEVVYRSDDPRNEYCVLDFGIRAISEDGSLLGMPLPPRCKAGDFVTGVIRLNLPLGANVTPYDLSYNWRVKRILADLADFSIYPGDRGKNDYLDISGTDTVQPGSYVLQCSLVE